MLLLNRLQQREGRGPVADGTDAVDAAASSGMGMSCSETKASPDSSNTHPLIAVLTKGFLPDERGEP